MLSGDETKAVYRRDTSLNMRNPEGASSNAQILSHDLNEVVDIPDARDMMAVFVCDVIRRALQ